MPPSATRVLRGIRAMIEFTVLGKPKPKQSFRYSRFGSYTSQDVKDYARHIQASFYKEYPNWLPSKFHEKPLEVEIDVFMQVAKTASKKRQQAMLTHEIRPRTRTRRLLCNRSYCIRIITTSRAEP